MINIDKILEKYPYNLRNTIFKEIMHYEILDSLFSISDIQKTLVFQGETALRLCYNSDRYSEDLDFCIHKNETFNKEFMDFFKNIFIEKILQKYNLQGEIIDPKEAKESSIQRWSAIILLPSDNKKTKINIEIADIPSHDNSFKHEKNKNNLPIIHSFSLSF